MKWLWVQPKIQTRETKSVIPVLSVVFLRTNLHVCNLGKLTLSKASVPNRCEDNLQRRLDCSTITGRSSGGMEVPVILKIRTVILQLQILIFFIQRPPPENIRSVNVALMYHNAYIKDFLVKIKRKKKISYYLVKQWRIAIVYHLPTWEFESL